MAHAGMGSQGFASLGLAVVRRRSREGGLQINYGEMRRARLHVEDHLTQRFRRQNHPNLFGLVALNSSQLQKTSSPLAGTDGKPGQLQADSEGCRWRFPANAQKVPVLVPSTVPGPSWALPTSELWEAEKDLGRLAPSWSRLRLNPV